MPKPMNILLRFAFAALCLAAVSTRAIGADNALPLAGGDLVFAEKDGLVAIEAEHFYEQALAERRAWHLTTRDHTPTVEPDGDPTHIAGASRGAYLELLPDTRRTHDDKLIRGENFSNEPGKMAVLSYKVHFQTPGTYWLWARAFTTTSEDNGLHFGINGTWPETAQRWQTVTRGRWHWQSRQRTEEVHVGVPGILTLEVPSAGVHTIHVSMREDGIALDKILLVNRRDYTPEGQGPEPAVKAGTLPPPFPFVAEPAAASVSAKRPNIIVIMADDVGWSDIGCYGSEIRTPHLDALAESGVRFTQFYNTARCCPTRASLLTGLYAHQAGIGHMVDSTKVGEAYAGDLSRKAVTIAEALKPAGYATYMTGKWHVTRKAKAANEGDKANWPRQRGFDRFYGTIHGAGSFFDPNTLTRDNEFISPYADPEYRPAEYYYTDAINDHAARFVTEHKQQHPDQPFFLYVAHTAAHWPMHAKESDIAKYKGKYDAGYDAIRAGRLEKLKQLGLLDPRWKVSPQAGDWKNVENKEWEARCMEVYAAMLDCMDQGIGRLVETLKKNGQFENTLILYLQDNGGCAEPMSRNAAFKPRPPAPTLPPLAADYLQPDMIPKQTRDGFPMRQGKGVMPGAADTYIGYGRNWANVSNTPFREYKHWEHEGGISTPLIAHWPAGIARERHGKLEPQPSHLIDLMTTCMQLSGAKYPAEFAGEKIQPMEGVSLAPAFGGNSLERKEPIFWEHEGNRAIRVGDWKLVSKHPGAWELYDMAADRTEMNDLAAQQPERVKEMTALWEAWAERVGVRPWPRTAN